MCKKTPVIVFPAAGVPVDFGNIGSINCTVHILSPLKKEPAPN